MIAEAFLTFPGLECWCWWFVLWVFADSSPQWQFRRWRNKEALSQEPCPPPTQMLGSVLIFHLLLANVRSVVFRLGERQVLLFQGCCQFSSMSWSCVGCFCCSSYQHIWVILSFSSFISALIASFTLLPLTLAEWNRVGLQHIQADTHKIVFVFMLGKKKVMWGLENGGTHPPLTSKLKECSLVTLAHRWSLILTPTSHFYFLALLLPVTFLVSFAQCSPELLGESLQSKHEQSSAACRQTLRGRETLFKKKGNSFGTCQFVSENQIWLMSSTTADHWNVQK